MDDSFDAKLNGRLAACEAEISREARRVARRALWDAARRYQRSRPWLTDLLPPDLLALALRDLKSPAVTWRVLRHLCRHIRFCRTSPLGSLARLRRCRTLAAGEVYLLSRQRAALRDRQFVGTTLRRICGAL